MQIYMFRGISNQLGNWTFIYWYGFFGFHCTGIWTRFWVRQIFQQNPMMEKTHTSADSYESHQMEDGLLLSILEKHVRSARGTTATGHSSAESWESSLMKWQWLIFKRIKDVSRCIEDLLGWDTLILEVTI